MIERLHRQLESSLKTRITDPYWIDHFRIVLLGIRTAWRINRDFSPAELVYGSSPRLLGEFVESKPVESQPSLGIFGNQ